MLRVFKPSSPMSVGVWILVFYGPLAAGTAASDVLGRRARGPAARPAIGAGLLGPAVASYTAALIADTAVPAWHEAHRELPFLFVGSAAAASAGFGLLAAPLRENEPARRMAVLGARRRAGRRAADGAAAGDGRRGAAHRHGRSGGCAPPRR